MSMQPTSNTALHKRIRRLVIGPIHTFTAVVSPGLESCCAAELGQIPAEVTDIMVFPGQVRFKSRFDGACLVNLYSRTASRILMHLAEFKATGFGRLEQKTAAVPWEVFLSPNALLRARVSVRNCRLRHTGALAELVVQAIKKRYLHSPSVSSGTCPLLSPEPDDRCTMDSMVGIQRVFVHGDRDRFTLSLDTTGTLLYKRGLKTHGGRAPIRETLAAGILMLAGYMPQKPLLDPMCGTGTFSLEAALMALGVPPGAFRTFAFMEWPAFKAAHWNHLVKAASEGARQPEKTNIFASDIDPGACEKLIQSLEISHLIGTVQVKTADFFSLSGKDFGPHPGLVVMNPPYGRRLDTPTLAQTGLADIFAKARRDFRGWRLALVSPYRINRRQADFCEAPRRLFHGGLALNLYTGKIP
jgi:putative N6-adenine-specific DNA methylase